MKNVFCYQHNIDRYNQATGSLTLLQHGAYLRLIHLYFKLVGKLPNDQRILCRLLSCQSKAERDAVAYAVAEFFTVKEDGFLTNAESEFELQRISNRSEENKAKAKAKWLKSNNTHDATAEPEHMPQQCCSNANLITNRIDKKDIPPISPLPDEESGRAFCEKKSSLQKEKFDPKKIEIPSWLSVDIWMDYCDHRKSIKKPLSEKACMLSIKQLEGFKNDGEDLTEIINRTIAYRWQGLFSTKKNNYKPKETYSEMLMQSAAMANKNLERNFDDEIFP